MDHRCDPEVVRMKAEIQGQEKIDGGSHTYVTYTRFLDDFFL